MIAALVKALVDRPKHAAIVKGLRRYAMLIVTPSSLFFFRGEVKSLLETASPESAILARAFAFARSIRVKRRPVTIELRLGKRENSGSRRGAYAASNVREMSLAMVAVCLPDEISHPRKERRCGCKEKDPLALSSY
jgi:hypothetical protein